MRRCAFLLAALGLALAPPALAAGGGWTLIGWNDLGMHCMDKDYSVFSILPPYNTIHAQLIDTSGRLVRNPAGIMVTYEAVRDPAGSINTTSRGKTEFWVWVSDLFGVGLAEDAGLAGAVMPGSANRPQPMTWDATQGWFTAEGIPITPRDDAGLHNTYPMMRLVARGAGGTVLATTQIVLPVSDEMACSSCHSSGAGPAARPAAGWVNDPNPEHDYRLNILRLHDELEAGDPDYAGALRIAGFRQEGLYATATGGHAILCARCHPSNALPGSGVTGISPLTRSIHLKHSRVVDPATGATLDSAANRDACYSCHPGSATRCLRGAMGKAVAADGTMAMQCQSCHGSMSQVGGVREGWLDQPDCQSCHTGTAMDNAGRIRFTSAFSAPGVLRQAVDPTFATNRDVPAPGFSLYRFSRGHGGLACEACHGSTHAEYPSSHTNDNVQSRLLQSHAGVLAECSTCHIVPFTVDGGPHGMHPIGPQWVRQHGDEADEEAAARQCQACHGADDNGTVLSMAKGDWTASMEFGTRFFWAGFQIGCYACHNGPGSEEPNRNRPPVAVNTSAVTNAQPVQIALSASDPDGDGLSLRIVSQPAHGTVGLAGTTAGYFPESGFSGTDTFTFAAWDGQINSNLGTVTVAVSGGGGGTCTLTCGATVPTRSPAGTAVSFAGTAQATHCTGLPTWAWTFGDGGTSTLQSPTHPYAGAGVYDWRLQVTVSGQSCQRSGRIRITAGTPPPRVTRVSRLSKPFRVVITGTGFHSDMKVYIGDRLWTELEKRGSVQVILREGRALQTLFPASTWVKIRSVNPDGQSAVVEYNRTTNRWRPAS